MKELGALWGVAHFQYSLCRVVLMVTAEECLSWLQVLLSVLALSSRFDGHGQRAAEEGYFHTFQYSLCRVVLMVRLGMRRSRRNDVFQYSLCRVVLMVLFPLLPLPPMGHFQYSLCRVVLMVMRYQVGYPLRHSLSVLALSSRFDGPGKLLTCSCTRRPFSTRSVESF